MIQDKMSNPVIESIDGKAEKDIKDMTREEIEKILESNKPDPSKQV